MPGNEDSLPAITGRRQRENALQLGPRKKPCVIISLILSCTNWSFSCVTDPLVHHGRHFGRTIHALCSINALLTNGLLRMGELVDEPDESFTAEYGLSPTFIPCQISWSYFYLIVAEILQGETRASGVPSATHCRSRSWRTSLRELWRRTQVCCWVGKVVCLGYLFSY